MTRHADRFAPNLILKLNLLALLVKVDRRDPDGALPRWARRSRAGQATARHWTGFAATLGTPLARIAFALFARTLRAPPVLASSLPEGS